MSTCKVEFKGFNIDSSSLDNYLNQFTIDGKRKIDGAKNTISYLLSNAEDNKLGVLKLALNSNKAYIKDLANMMLNTNRKFYAEVEINNNLQGFSKYNANDNKIYINVDAISQRFSESAEEYLYERIVHDFIQGFANRELKKALTDANRDSPYMRNIINLFKEYQNITDNKQYDLFKGSIEKEPLLDPRSERSLVREGYAEGTYRAMTNLAEFLSYGLSSTQFRNTLRKQNLWQKFVSWLKDLLGLSKDNNDLEYLYKNLDAYLKQDDPYTLHSGGATGADTVWGQIGKQFGISEENQMHYKTADMPNGNTQITEQDYKEGKREAAKAANRMFGYDKPEVSMGLLIRNWSQVKYSDAVYAVGRLVPAGENAFPDNKKEDTRIAKNPTVTGGTGYAVNMAILNNKPVYVYNQYDHPTYPKGWYKYDSNINDYVPTDTPTLTRHFAGIGTRNINEDGKKAIQDAYEKTFNKKTEQQQTSSQEETTKTQENYGEEFQVDQFVFSYNPETSKYYQHFKSKKGEVKELTNEKQQNKTFLKYIEKHPEHAEIVTYENTGNKYVYDEQRDKVISLSTGDTIVQPDIVDKVKNHEEYEHKKEVERVKRIIKSNISSLNDIDMLELLHELRNNGYDIKDEVVYFEALLEIREDEKKEINKKEEPIKKEEIAKEEKLKKEEKPENSFSYKGITIPTKFKLSEEQEQALITLIENITSGDEEPITLSGYAGTGKSSIIGYLEDYLKRKRGYKFLYGAPTHAATLYLGYNTKKMPFTIASSVVKRMDDFGNVTYTTSSKVDQALSDYDQNIFVVDEVSLMDSTTMDNFLSVMNKKGIKVIFMGDKMQLPEVASKGKINPETKNPIKDVSKAFTDFKLIQLSQVQRTKDNAILRVLTEIRNNPDGVLPVVDNTETLQFFNKDDNTKGFYKGFRIAYEADPEEAIYITYTNEDVKNFNKSFRKAFYGEDVDGLVEGESVIGYSGYNNKKIKSNDLANSIKYTVDSIRYDGSEVKITLKSNAVQKLADLHSPNRENDKTVQTTYLQMSRTDSLDMKNLTDEDFLKNNIRLSETFRDVYDLKKRALETNRWRDFGETLAEMTSGLAKLEIGDDYFYNPYTNMMEKESSVNWSKPEMANLKRNYKELFMSKSIDYGYGITIHKAQGATYKNVFFNATSTEFAKTEIHENGMQISTEGNSLNYVAMSRASEKLFVLHSNNIKRLNNDDSIELSKNCSVF